MTSQRPGAEPAGPDLSATARAWLERATGIAAERLRLERMAGSTSTTVCRVRDPAEPAAPGYVLRLLDNRAWLANEPDLAAHEAAALREARRAGLPAPELVAYAETGAGFGVPVVLMTFLEGRVELRPADRDGWLERLAGTLARIHGHSAKDLGWRYRSWVDATVLDPPGWSAAPDVWRDAVARWREPAPDAPTVFVHRDFHPTNILWRDGEVSGVVDWINACRGPAGVDLAHCRINLALMDGPDTAARFLELYLATAPGTEHDPWWDLDAILDSCLPRPGFYPPWRTFGLDPIPQRTLERRLETHLRTVLRRA